MRKSVYRRRELQVKAANIAELRSQFLDQGIELITSSSSEEFAGFLRRQTEEFAKLAKQAGITME
jgi:hypothetical protein